MAHHHLSYQEPPTWRLHLLVQKPHHPQWNHPRRHPHQLLLKWHPHCPHEVNLWHGHCTYQDRWMVHPCYSLQNPMGQSRCHHLKKTLQPLPSSKKPYQPPKPQSWPICYGRRLHSHWKTYPRRKGEMHQGRLLPSIEETQTLLKKLYHIPKQQQ